MKNIKNIKYNNYYIIFGLIVLFLVVLNYNNLTNFFKIKEGAKNEEQRDAMNTVKAKITENEETLATNEELDEDKKKVTLPTYLETNERTGKARKILPHHGEYYKIMFQDLKDKLIKEKEELKSYSEHTRSFKQILSAVSMYATLIRIYSEHYDINFWKETEPIEQVTESTDIELSGTEIGGGLLS